MLAFKNGTFSFQKSILLSKVLHHLKATDMYVYFKLIATQNYSSDINCRVKLTVIILNIRT